jgi:hypothetical protein
MLDFLGKLATLSLRIFEEYYNAQARSREINEKFVLDDIKFNSLVNSVLSSNQSQASTQSSGADQAWDAAQKKEK